MRPVLEYGSSVWDPHTHGRNGLDPTTCVHLIKIYVLPVLTYGLPKQKHIDKLDVFLKKIVKQTLSLPTQTADPVIYIVSGLLPIEGQIHIKTLNFFNNICGLPENTIEKRLARRQVSVKSSASWFIKVEKLLWTYDPQDIGELLDSFCGKSSFSNGSATIGTRKLLVQHNYTRH